MTKQISEILIYEGKQFELHSELGFPKNHPEIIETPSEFVSSACWRGYVGTWEIKQRQLFLNELSGNFSLSSSSLAADWFTGLLTVPESGKSDYYHCGWGHIYEQNKIISIVKGIVTNIEYQDKTAAGYMEDWAKALFNCTMGAIAEASANCRIQPDGNDKDNKLVIFTFEHKKLLEIMTGKLLLALQKCRKTLPITTYLGQSDSVESENKHMLIISVSLSLAMEIDKMFIGHTWSNSEISTDDLNGFWHFG